MSNDDNQLTPREIKRKIKAQNKENKKDKCFFDKTRECDPTCKSHSHNEALGGVKLLQWAKLLFWRKGWCKLLKMMDEGKVSLKEAKSLFGGTE